MGSKMSKHTIQLPRYTAIAPLPLMSTRPNLFSSPVSQSSNRPQVAIPVIVQFVHMRKCTCSQMTYTCPPAHQYWAVPFRLCSPESFCDKHEHMCHANQVAIGVEKELKPKLNPLKLVTWSIELSDIPMISNTQPSYNLGT